MTQAAITIPLDRLTVEERLKLIDELWQSLEGKPDAVPDWQKADLEARHQQYLRDGKALSFEEAMAKTDARLKRRLRLLSAATRGG